MMRGLCAVRELSAVIDYWQIWLEFMARRTDVHYMRNGAYHLINAEFVGARRCTVLC